MINRSSDAFITSNGILSLTKNQVDLKREDSVGRAVYAEEMHLWDAGTGQMADFSTHFSFNISLLQAGWIGDGFTFFLSQNGSQVPELAWGGCLALITNCSNLNQSENPIVAVEFDTYKNDWDPSDNHVVININSIQSVTNLTWDTSMKNGSRANAWISYNSQTSNLSLFLTYLDNPVFLGNSTLSYEVDLSKILPEWVSVGFSSSTGAGVEIHYILSWEFNSTELISDQGEYPIPPTSNNGNKAQGGANIGVVIGSVVGGLVLVGGIISTLVFSWRKRSGKAEDQQSTVESDDHSIDNEFEHGMGPKSPAASFLPEITIVPRRCFLRLLRRRSINLTTTPKPRKKKKNRQIWSSSSSLIFWSSASRRRHRCFRSTSSLLPVVVVTFGHHRRRCLGVGRFDVDDRDSLAEEAKAKLEEMEPFREAWKKLCTSFLKGRL
ncbi:hypothetical protein LWI29_016207 [Acer saccharum]|uniref:Legume lectin domain-containing protein n=1 Tax=Acer saccharum TaxID=4024 RepID=A0AA39W907_ACESA|nr:hypothetical protein LWI29_016207 [Acer saccharum]